MDAARRVVREGASGLGLGDPAPLLRGLADAIDEVLGELWRVALPESASRGIALVGLGSYGRRELFPFSDVDLLLIHQGASEATVEGLVEDVVYPLWDAKLAVSHAVRNIDEALDLAAEDLTLRTALLDARLVAGDEGPFHSLGAGAYREVFGPERLNDFRSLLVEERRQRHLRFGETVHLLEPNIKSGAGGLRDINTGLWAAKARFGVESLEDLTAHGVATARQQGELSAARVLLQRVRLAMHLTSQRAQDRLLFELQEEIAPALFPDAEIPGDGRRGASAVAPAVERLMHAFYRAARAVVLETEGLLQRCFDDAPTDPQEPRGAPGGRPPARLEPPYELLDRSLSLSSPELLWEQPEQLLGVFEVAADAGLRLGRPLQDAVAEAAAGDPGRQLPADAETAERFRRLLSRPEPDDALLHGRSLLERMHDLGVLAALIPEFEPCTGRVQHDLYHVYTVDRHSLAVVCWLKALCAGQPLAVPRAAGLPRAASPQQVAEELEDLEPLLLAALLHDVAKPLGRRHSEKGAILAAGVAARLGVDWEGQREIAFLVRRHLTMQHISQRRDLSDPLVAQRFAEEVGDPQRLRRLYLLALADTANTAPGNLDEWKASLFGELYLRTLAALEGRRGRATAEVQGDTQRAALARHLEPLAGLAELLPRIPEELLQQPLEILQHLAPRVLELEARIAAGEPPGGGPVAPLVDVRERGTATLVSILCPDAPGLLAKITGVLLLERVEVLAAQVYTISPVLSPPTRSEESALLLPSASPRGGEGMALDLFWVPPGTADDDRWRSVERRLEEAIGGDLDLEEALRRPASALPRRVLPGVPTEVRCASEASPRGTILELSTADRRGLLHSVTRKLSDLSLAIVASRVSTQAGRVVDTFYLRERDSGEPPRAPERLRAITEAVHRVIGELSEED